MARTITLESRFADALRAVSDESPAGPYLHDNASTFHDLDQRRSHIDATVEQWLAAEQERVPGGSDEAEQLGAINARWFEQVAGAAHREDWAVLEQAIIDALAHESKDLRLLKRLVEASAYGGGFGGVADALETAAMMIDQFWDTIHPAGADVGAFHDYLDVRRQMLAWFNDPKEGLPYLVTTLPLSASPGEAQVTLRHLLAAPRQLPGWPSEETIRRVIGATPPDALAATGAALDRCLAACTHLEEVLTAKLASNGCSRLQGRLTQCRTLVTDAAGAGRASASHGPARVGGPAAEPIGDTLRLRLEALQRQAAKASSPREAFLAELSAVDACLDANLWWIASTLLEHVLTMVDIHELDSWESPEVLARIRATAESCRRVATTNGHELPRLDRLHARADTLSGAPRADARTR